jgi:hypothetical protein
MLIEDPSAHLEAEVQFQNAYARFLTDDQFRERVLNAPEPEETIGELTGATIRRLREMNPDRVELFAQCLFGNRMAAIEEAFPLTVKMMGTAAPPLVRALDAVDIATDTRKYPEALRFAEFVLNSETAETQALPNLIVGLLRYELIFLNLRVRPQLPEWPDATIHSAGDLRLALDAGKDIYLMLNRNHALVSVDIDVELLRELDTQEIPASGTEAGVMILLHRGDNGIVHEERLNPASAAAVLMIEEARTFRKLVSAYGAWLGRQSEASLDSELKELCIGLCARGALGFEPVVSVPCEDMRFVRFAT